MEIELATELKKKRSTDAELDIYHAHYFALITNQIKNYVIKNIYLQEKLMC